MAESKEQFRQSFAARVRIEMERLELSQRGLQGRLSTDLPGGSYNNVNNALRGRTTPNAQLAAAIAEVLDCDPGWLLVGEGTSDHTPMSDEEAAECGLLQVPSALRNSLVSFAFELAPLHLPTGCGLEAAFATISELAKKLGEALLAPFSGPISLPTDKRAAVAILSSQLRVIRWAVARGQFDMDLPERLKPPLSAQDRSDLVVDAIWHGHEPPRVEVGRLSEDQEGIDELFEARRREARQDEVKKLAKERRRYVLAQERRRSTRRQAGERPPAADEPRPNEPGPAVLGEEYSGPPVREPEELTPEEKEALAERKRQTKAKQKEAAKRDRQRS